MSPQRMKAARRVAVTHAIAAGVVMAAAVTAQATTTVVPPGGSIQAAVDAATPGDTIRLQRGTYEGGVTITTNGLSIRGAGPRKTVLVQPAAPAQCAICVFGDAFDPSAFFVRDISIRGLSIEGFGVFGFLVNGLSVADVEVNGAGITIADGVDVDIRSFRSNRATSAGVWLGGTNRATVSNSTVRNSGGPGFEVFASHNGRIHHSSAIGNCVGVELRTGILPEPTAVVGLSAWRVDHVTVLNNTRACEPRRLGGAGIAVSGGRGLQIDHNVVLRNGRSGAPTPGGIVIEMPYNEADDPNPGGVSVQSNTALRNVPFDLSWDEELPDIVSFVENRCATSKPAGLCDPSQGGPLSATAIRPV